MSDVIDRFMRYIKIDTESDVNSDTCPSTKKQLDLAILLKNELDSIGL